MSKLPSPIPRATFENIIGEWIKIINFDESGCIYFPSKGGLLRRLNQFLGDTLLKDRLLSTIEIKIIDIDSQVIEDKEDLEKVLGHFQKKKGAIFVLGADRILKEGNKELLENFASLANFNPNLSILLFFHQDFTHPKFTPLFIGKNILLENVVIHSLYSLKDVYQFLRYLEAKWQVKLPAGIKKQIVKRCGGHLWFVKQAVRFLRDHPKAWREVFTHKEMQLKLGLTWQNFLQSEKWVLEKIIKGQENFDDWELHSLNFLKRAGWIKKIKDKWQLSIPLLEEFVRDKMAKTALPTLTKDGKILLGQVVVEPLFSSNERKVLKCFLTQKRKIVGRDMIACVLWGKRWQEHYSDWAIDQLIHRLRKKLSSLGLSPNLIRTVRGKGFCWEGQ